ncbi:MAG: septation protein IspZ [Rickettsiales bacterium]|jgi:intracellular septation protein|nr:septation protein IspZ [Rickettsiales bacterium]
MKTLIDILPLLGFLIAYKLKGILAATVVLVILSLISIVFLYYTEKKVAKVPLFSAIIVIFFGGLTIIFGDPIFIKLKPTIINICFALALLIGNMRGKPLLKLFLDKSLSMPDVAWAILSRRYAFLFVILAILNELVWRNFTEDIWVNFKVFGILGISMIFILTQMPFITKNNKA